MNNALAFAGAAVAGYAVLWFLEDQEILHLTHHAYGGGGGGYGGGTPGWYTEQGHHHCKAHTPGCACTDPKKCMGHAGTGAPYCAANPAECVPVPPDHCFAYYSSDIKNCGDCPSGTATGNCAK